jgi:putative transposase
MAVSFKGAHFPPDIILMGIRWYVAYPLSTRHVEELMEERGAEVDHSTINRWVIKYSPQLEETFHRRKRPVWLSWRMDETYIKVKGQWRYLYRAVDKHGQTIDFLLTEHRDKEAALRFLKKAIRRNGVPERLFEKPHDERFWPVWRSFGSQLACAKSCEINKADCTWTSAHTATETFQTTSYPWRDKRPLQRLSRQEVPLALCGCSVRLGA